MTKIASRKLPLFVPQTFQEAGKAVVEIDALWSDIDALLAQEEADIKALKKASAEKITLKRQKIDQIGEGVSFYAQSHYDELTQHGKVKTVPLPIVGALKWRKGKKSVKILLPKEAAAAELKARGLKSLVRTKEEPDKQKILVYQKPENLEGIATIQSGGESFIIELPNPKGKKPREVKYPIG